MNEVIVGLLSGLVGYSLGKEKPPTDAEVVNYLRERKPVLFKTIPIDTSVARENVEFPSVGVLLFVENPDTPTKPVYVRLNEPDSDKIDLTTQRKVKIPFYRFFITNEAGAGTLDLVVCKTSIVEFAESVANVLVKGSYDNSGTPTPVTIAVDVDGRMLALMKGAYGTDSVLKTIATDAKGRMLAVMTDPEDIWGNPHELGNAELAARLGSIDTFDRRGNVLWFDDFESGLNKWMPETPAGSIAISAERARNGCFSCKLSTPAVANQWARIRHWLPYVFLSKMGFEFSFTWDADIKEIIFCIDFVGGGHNYVGAIKYLYPGFVRWQYLAGDWFYRDIMPSYLMDDRDYTFNTVKLIIDFPNGKYDKCLINGQSFDLSQYPLIEFARVAPNVITDIEIAAKADVVAYSYIDDVIITQNEP